MKDITKRILKVFEKEPLIGSFATVTEEGKPWVRYISLDVNKEDFSIQFATFIHSRKVKQIEKNPEVHITCGDVDLENPSDYLQIQGTATVSTEQKDKDALWNEMLAQYFQTPTNPDYAVVTVKPYRIEVWGLEMMEPLVWEK